MPYYRWIMRKAEPPGTLEITDDYCEAKNKDEAKDIFEGRHGPERTVAGPVKVDSIPADRR